MEMAFSPGQWSGGQFPKGIHEISRRELNELNATQLPPSFRGGGGGRFRGQPMIMIMMMMMEGKRLDSEFQLDDIRT